MSEVFTFDKPHLQKDGLFKAFPKPIWKYIFENVKVNHWKKLYKTCKYFYFIFPNIIVDYMDFDDYDLTCKVDSYELDLTEKYKNTTTTNFWLCNTFHCMDSSNFISEIIPKISFCHIRNLEFEYMKIKMNELQFLAESKMIEKVCLYTTKIMDSKTFEEAHLENIIALFPNAFSIEIDEANISPETSLNLYCLKRTKKLKRFRLTDIQEGEMDVKLIYHFLMKNAAIDARCFIQFNDRGYSEAFEDALKMELDKINWSNMLEPEPELSSSNQNNYFDEKEKYFHQFWNSLPRWEKRFKKEEEMKEAHRDFLYNKIYDKFRFFFDGIENPMEIETNEEPKEMNNENEIYRSFRMFLNCCHTKTIRNKGALIKNYDTIIFQKHNNNKKDRSSSVIKIPYLNPKKRRRFWRAIAKQSLQIYQKNIL